MKKGIIYSFIISMVICMMMPFSVFADTWSDHLTGITFSNQKNIVTFTFDTHVLGSFVPEIKFKYTSNGTENTIRPTIRINGSQVSYVIYNDYIYDVTVNKYSSSLQVVSDLDLSGVITILSQMYNNQEDILDQLELIYGNSEISTKIRQYNIPMESYPLIYTYFLSGYETFETLDYRYTTYPLFKFSKTSQPLLLRTQAYTNDTEFSFIFFSNINLSDSISSFNNYFTVENCSVVKMERLSNYQSSNQVFNLCKVTLKAIGNYSDKKVYYNGTFWNDVLIAPVVIDDPLHNNYSTDFALIFGLSNDLLDDLHIIAAGTQQSQSAAGDLEQGTSDLASDISSYNQIESDYNNQMNQALNNIDFSDQFSNNQNFLSGASFVKTVFNSFMQIDILRIFFIVLCIVLIAKRFI